MEVTAAGLPNVSFLDASGKIVRQIRPTVGE